MLLHATLGCWRIASCGARAIRSAAISSSPGNVLCRDETSSTPTCLRTVGCLPPSGPYRLKVRRPITRHRPGSADTVIKQVKERLAAPVRGLEYGSADRTSSPAAAATAAQRCCFNYLGRLTTGEGTDRSPRWPGKPIIGSATTPCPCPIRWRSTPSPWPSMVNLAARRDLHTYARSSPGSGAADRRRMVGDPAALAAPTAIRRRLWRDHLVRFTDR